MKVRNGKTKRKQKQFLPIYACIRMELGITRQKHRKSKKGRSLVTYQNKIKKTEKWYKRTFNNSEKKNGVKKSVFCIKYPTLDKFLEVNKIKKAS